MRICLRRFTIGLLMTVVIAGSLAAGPSAYAGGAVEVEIYSYPSVVAPGQLATVKVRVRFSGDDNDGPWQVNWIGIRDSDLAGAYQTIAFVNNPITINVQGVWYSHDFYNVHLSDWDDGGDGIELYAVAEVNDNDFNGYDPNGSSAIYQVGVSPTVAMSPSPTSGATSRSINTGISWANGGGASSYDVYFGTDSTPDSGEFKRNQTGTTYNPGTLAYNKTYYWRIDANNYAGATEGNVWSFTTESPPPAPDLIVQDIYLEPASPVVGQSVTIHAVVKNQGNANAGWFANYFYVDGTKVQDTTTWGLAAGDTHDTTVFYTATSSGSKPVKVVADAKNEIDEGDNDGINERIENFTWSPPPAPDLVVTDIYLDPANPVVGQSVTIHAVVKNQGNANAGWFANYFYVDGSKVQDTTTWGLAAGDTHDTTVSYTATSSGSKPVKVVADANNNEIDEGSNEGNNETTEYFTFIDTTGAKITSFVPQTGLVNYGSTGTVTVVMQNTGTAARAFWVGLSFSGPSSATWPDGWYDVEPQQTATLVKDGTQTINYQFVITNSMPPGQYVAHVAIWEGYNLTSNLMVEPLYASRESNTFVVSGEYLPGVESDPYGLLTLDAGGLYGQIPEGNRNGLSDLLEHIATPLANAKTGLTLSSSNDRVVVVIHGWNPDGLDSPLRTNKWADVTSQLRAEKLGREWSLVEYDWHNDANTGFIRDRKSKTQIRKTSAEPQRKSVVIVIAKIGIISVQMDAEHNAVRAAERAYAHGIVLGQRLVQQIGASNLKQVQLVGHSAGSWAIYSALRYLAEHAPNCEVQITYLDPFIPDQTSFYMLPLRSHPFKGQVLEQSVNYSRVTTPGAAKAEAYYTALDETELSNIIGWPTEATSVSWTWNSVSNAFVQELFFLSPSSTDWFGHSGPVDFWGDSISTPTAGRIGGLGWNKSLAYNTVFPGALQFNPSAYTVDEAAGTVTLTVTRIGGSSGAASVNYVTANGTATAGADYTTKSGTLNWSNGDSANKTFTVSITDDADFEGSETFNVSLSGVSGASLGTPATATVTINDNETPPPGSIQLSSATYSVNENGGTVTIMATRTGGSYGAASVSYTTANGSAKAGADYTTKSGTLNWSNGDSANKTFTVSITDDAAFEGDEMFTVSLSSASGASLGSPAAATVTIVDNDTPARGAVQFASATYSVAESGSSITLNVTRQGGSYGAASVNYATANGTATAGSDYTSRSGTLNWSDGDTATKTFSVPILDDSIYEGNKTFTSTLSGAVGSSLGSPSTTTVTIQEDEVQPDTQKPTVQITAPTTATTYTSPTNRLNIGGTASDNVGVANVKARNFRDIGDYTCTGTTSWQYNGLPLFQGLNNISVIAYDAAGNSQTDTVAVTYNGDTQYDDVLRSGGIVQEIIFPDNLTPGTTVTVRWKILSYVPVVARVYGGIPGGWYFYKNGTYTGYAESPWNLSGRHAGVYSFECSWPVPQKSGDFDVWFNMAQMDCDQFMIPVIPDGVDSRPDPSYAKLIQRTILAGGNGTDPTSDPDTWNSATVFETVNQHRKRSAAAVTSVTLADNLTQGSQVTCEWKILSYVPVKAQLLLLNLTQQQVWLTANATQVGSAVQTTYNFQDRTTGTRYYASEYTFRATFTVPNQPGTQQIFFRCQESANSSSSWMGANISADIDSRPAQYNGMYGRFIERTISP